MKQYATAIAAFAGAFLISGAAWAQISGNGSKPLKVNLPKSGSPSGTQKLVIEHCLVSAFDEVQLPGREAGVLQRFEPNTSREGTEVKKGDLLGELDSADLVAKREGAALEIEVAEAQ